MLRGNSAVNVTESSFGTFHYEVKYQGIVVKQNDGAFCSFVQCPVAIGDFLLNSTQIIPHNAPRGSYTVRVSAQAIIPLFCVDVAVNI